jgi:hypothetical protein
MTVATALHVQYDRRTGGRDVVKTLAAGLTCGVVVALAQADLNRSERIPGEAHAIGALRAIVSAQASYAAINGGFAPSLTTLSTACSRGPHAFVSPDLGRDPAVFGDYEVRMQPGPRSASGRLDCDGNVTTAAYYATAIPLTRGRRERPAFAVDEIGAIWYDATGVPPKPPFHETSTVKPLR